MYERILCVIFSFASLVVAAQSTVRQQIDNERKGGSFTEEKTYEKGRGFIRRDSTYYVGYLLEGGYLFFRANDELGYRKASIPLRKALDRIEHDFDPLLRMRTNNYNDYSANYRYQFDYGLITDLLNRCYQNVEDEDKAMEVLRHIRDRNFQVEINSDSYNSMAWLYHRNRVFTSEHFSFLKNSVKENVEAANRCLDSAIQKIRNDFPLNNGLYDPNFLNRQFLSTFHYKAMIHDYLLDIDSANYYYDLLIQNQAVSANNYAEFKLAMGEFEEAELYFREAEQQQVGVEKNTKEYYYMRGTLATYRGHPEQADTLLSNVLQSQGSTPGYGWHSIGLARAQHYEGLTAESQDRANKAARFQELHIGTTWGQEQYNLAVASLNYINHLQFKKEYRFEHNAWYTWFNPVTWYRWIKYTLAIRHHKMVLASLIAENPEREQVIYTIFSPENLMNFDEVWTIIDGFGNEYFIDVYEKLLSTDKRPRLKKYFRYFLGKLYLAEGDETKATEYFNQALQATDLDDAFQTMLVARTYEGLALASSGAEREQYTQQVYRLYPQLLPFSNLTMKFQINVQTSRDTEKDIVDDLRNTNINFVSDKTVPEVTLTFTSRGESLDVLYQVQSKGEVLHQGVFRVEQNEFKDAGKLIAYRLFNIHKTKIGEQPPAAESPEPVKKKEEKPV